MPVGLEDHLPAGFLLTSVEKWAQYAWSRSMWTATFGLACCAIEMMQSGGSRCAIPAMHSRRLLDGALGGPRRSRPRAPVPGVPRPAVALPVAAIPAAIPTGDRLDRQAGPARA
jgi:hypothetical protein